MTNGSDYLNYESLNNEADDLNITIKEKRLKLRDGLCCGDRIAISNDLKTLQEKNCVLAEELGHYHTTCGNILDLSDIRNSKQEKRARNWAYEKLVSIVSLINAFEKGIRTRSELAEYLDVTEKFLGQAIEHYREKYGLYYIVDHYTICFEPSFVIIKMFKPI